LTGLLVRALPIERVQSLRRISGGKVNSANGVAGRVLPAVDTLLSICPIWEKYYLRVGVTPASKFMSKYTY